VVPQIAKELYEAYVLNHESISLDMAAGRICGTIIVSYPPGTPLLCPGEIIDGYVVKYIKKVINAGGAVLGVEDNKIPVLE
ncbi:MAG: arginine decarboxylase, partial [Clostridiales bacterium]|nr:arginine decarboxylase [Clostridiales bacterium]